jgi:4a-hydroxytetrahydrobiopterin dehydratase
MADLTRERCVACRKDASPLSETQIMELLAEVPQWRLLKRDGIPQLVRIFSFINFVEALAFTLKVGELAEREEHHPAILTEWGRVTVSWWTQAIGGLHRNDFVMAAKTDELLTSS